MTYITKIISILIALANVVNLQTIDPFEIGPYEVSHHHFDSGSYEGLEENLDVFAPMSDGNFPAVYFLDGVAMSTPGDAYAELTAFIASHGMVVIVPTTELMIRPSEKVAYLLSTMDWCEKNLEELLHAGGVPSEVTIDYQTLYGVCHSAGSHVLVELLKSEGCKNFKAMVLLSPVDGYDPLGVIHDFCITPGEELNFAIPTLHISAGLDPVIGSSGLACAPEKLSNERFWNALNSESHRWSINATDFAHCDLMDDAWRILVETTLVCPGNELLTDDQYTTYRRFLGGTAISFFKALIEEQCDYYLQYLEDPSLMLIPATERHVTPTEECPRQYCTWTPPV